MDIDMFRGISTAVLMVLFVALTLFAYGKGRRAQFEEAARLPLADDSAPPRKDTEESS